mmetsp:Transcript_16181/g.18721  ORF Transcript_16181/g.18721 Transcript_16181/m.18721 type:complete len:90 (+) Transcript_16181:227-496(+)|eukprot:CAMPEP_0168335310 /NCGR_PEP_ID=MMETSP0213-20121227/10827_1 /TAXON_ID=151035 /ORGANISM="Euplotes harpa, Strain FSP1.4" /LENGTH=89 /DNA_ID=CAMNT_0008340201 /DNA_START=244 /DNA_END=513 /DNA_ORIENTATION=-
MKGTLSEPRCKFSRTVAEILKHYELKNLFSVNVLESHEIREEIKTYSNWPTIPQVFVKAEFIGGCDIMKEMHASGSLKELLSKHSLIPK